MRRCRIMTERDRASFPLAMKENRHFERSPRGNAKRTESRNQPHTKSLGYAADFSTPFAPFGDARSARNDSDFVASGDDASRTTILRDSARGPRNASAGSLASLGMTAEPANRS